MSATTDAHGPALETRRLPALLKLVAGACLALLAMEGLVRQAYTVTYTRVPGFGYVRRSVLYRLEGNGRSRWTTYELRRPRPPDPARPSIVVLGDSFTEALMVGDDEVFTGRLERELRAEGDDVQVLNLGYSGLSPADYVAGAPLYRRLFAPRWTIIQVGSSDLTFDSWDPGKCHFVRSPDGRGLSVVAFPPHFEEVRDNPWKQRVRAIPIMLLHHGFERFEEFMSGAQTEPPLFRAGSPVAAPSRLDRENDPSYPIEEEMDLLEKTYEGRLTLIFLPRLDMSNPLAPESHAEERFDAHCAAGGLSCVNLRRAYPAFAAEGRSPFGFANSSFNAGHMNAEGHAAAARALHTELTRLRTRGLL